MENKDLLKLRIFEANSNAKQIFRRFGLPYDGRKDWLNENGITFILIIGGVKFISVYRVLKICFAGIKLDQSS